MPDGQLLQFAGHRRVLSDGTQGGEFVLDRRLGYAYGLMGGNLWFFGDSVDSALEAAEAGAQAVDATVTLAHSHTRGLMQLTREADILVAAAGSPGIISAEHVKPGAAVFDVGVSRVDGIIRGDVQFDLVREVVDYLTPMPGGTGLMAVACLMANTVKAELHSSGN